MAEKDNKKRKRQSNGVQSPSKKVALDDNQRPSGNIKVNFIQNGSHPVIASAPGLEVPKTPFKAYSRVRSIKSEDQAVTPVNHDLLLQSSAHPRLDYDAVPSLQEQQLSHYVAVFDHSKNQLHITPVHRLDMSVKVRAEEKEVAERGNILQQREALGLEFGTKKARKVLASKTENAITTDTKGKGKATDTQTALLDDVGETAARIGIKDEKKDADLLLASKPIPRPNMDAESVEEVYAFDALVPPQDSRQLQVKELQEKARAGEEIMFHHQFPAVWIHDNGSSDDILKFKALRYMMLLLEFNALLTKAGPSSKKVPKKEVLSKRLTDWPPQLVDAVRRRFANEGGNELSKWHLDNLYSHICALALYVNGWITDTSVLRDDLRLDTKQMSQYFLELGCKVAPPTVAEQTARKLSKAKAANTRIARLRLPLEFPKPRKGKRQG